MSTGGKRAGQSPGTLLQSGALDEGNEVSLLSDERGRSVAFPQQQKLGHQSLCEPNPSPKEPEHMSLQTQLALLRSRCSQELSHLTRVNGQP